MYILHTTLVSVYMAGVRVWAWGSTVGASELRSQREGACDACRGAHPTQKDKAPMACERTSGRSDSCMVDTSGHGSARMD